MMRIGITWWNSKPYLTLGNYMEETGESMQEMPDALLQDRFQIPSLLYCVSNFIISPVMTTTVADLQKERRWRSMQAITGRSLIRETPLLSSLETSVYLGEVLIGFILRPTLSGQE